jgi:hypothetical protein
MTRSCFIALLVFLGSCSKSSPSAQLRAFQVSDREQLIGGTRALGEVGDFLIMNDKIRVVIQDAGFSRGFGVYGGSIIDADLRRPDEEGHGAAALSGGHDTFAEMFPAFFFQAVACDKVVVLTDGSAAFDQRYGSQKLHYDAGTAVVRASGGGGEFLTMLKLFDSLFLDFVLPAVDQSPDGQNELLKLGLLLKEGFTQFEADIAKLTNTNARYEIDYVLKPGSHHLQIHSRMINTSSVPLAVPSAIVKNPTFQMQLGGADLSGVRVPIGTVMLYGRLNDVWLPGVGFDLRHPMFRSFRRGLALPAFNGIVSEFIASAADRMSDRVSYGLIAEPSDNNFVSLNADAYRNGGAFSDTWTPIDNTSLLVPFTAISFIGVFTEAVQTSIQPGEYVEAVQDFIVGNGDVASIVDDVNATRSVATGQYDAIMRDALSGEPVTDGQLLIYQELASVTTDQFTVDDDYLDAGLRLCATASPNNLCRPFSQDYPDDAGNLGGSLPPGRYAYRVQGSGRALGPFVPFEIKAGEHTMLEPVLPQPAWVQAFAADADGKPIPAKVTLVGQYDQVFSDSERRSGGVFDLQAGESYRFTDMLDDRTDGQRGYIEATGYTDASGQALLLARPGDYIAYFSRGFEYDLQPVPVHVSAGSAAQASAQLTRVVDTTGWMSMDGHVHDVASIDSALATDERLLSAAGDGVEIAISTNHNYVTDWRPWVDQLSLNQWITSFVGMEFTTLESGHFNAYPLDYPVAPITHGSFEWFGHPPGDLFAGLRARASGGGEAIVACNHPRDANMGYFNQYGLSSITGGMIAWGDSKRLAGTNGPAFFDANGVNTFDFGCDAYEIINSKLGHEIHSWRVPSDWPAACYQPLPPGFDPKTQMDPCSLHGKPLRPAGVTGALQVGTILTVTNTTALPGPSGLDNVEAVFPGAVDDWFNLINLGYRPTGLATSDTHETVGEEPGAPRTYLYFGGDEPLAVTPQALVDALKHRRAATLSHGPFLTFTVAEGTGAAGMPIGGELAAPSGNVTVSYKLAAPPWVSVSRIQLFVNGRLTQVIPVDADRNLADTAPAPGGPVVGQIPLSLTQDSWIVLEAAGDRPMFPVITGTEEPFLLISDAVGALASAIGLPPTTDVGAVVIGNEQPFALTNPVWVRLGAPPWQPPGVVPFVERNDPAQDPHIGVLRTRNNP